MRLNKNITERLNLLKEAVGFLPDEKILPTYLKIANIYTKECRLDIWYCFGRGG